MARFYGIVGFCMTKETAPGVYEVDVVEERKYCGNIVRQYTRFQPSQEGGSNDDISISDDISIVCDTYALDNMMNIRYVIYRGVKWKVRNVRPEHPRLILTLGGVYNV